MSPRPDARVAGWAGASCLGLVHRCIREAGGRKKLGGLPVWSSGGWLSNCKRSLKVARVHSTVRNPPPPLYLARLVSNVTGLYCNCEVRCQARRQSCDCLYQRKRNVIYTT